VTRPRSILAFERLFLLALLLWAVRQALKSQLFHLLRDRLAEQHARNHGSAAHLDRVLRLADPANPRALTIGFARRFATYKRAALLLKDLERLQALLRDEERPVQFVFAGKAHPADRAGQDLIRRMQESQRPRLRDRIVFLEDYDMHVAHLLVQGCDVWLNNPRRPLEASGTSGMKASINGVPYMSIGDGWWAEGYTGDNGWLIDGQADPNNHDAADAADAAALYCELPWGGGVRS